MDPVGGLIGLGMLLLFAGYLAIFGKVDRSKSKN